MSRMAALVFLGEIAASSSSSGAGITAEQAMANYRAMIRGGMSGPVEPASCPDHGNSSEIVVCKRNSDPGARLPMPEDRFEPGEVVHHLGEPPPAQAPSAPRLPSKQAQTVGKLFGLLREAVTGEDPDD